MTKTYQVERQTIKDHNDMMGGYHYHTEILTIEAETAEEAGKKAEEMGYIVNYGYIRTLEEVEAEEKRIEEAILADRERLANARAKRQATELKKAAELGLTIEEYKAEKAKKAKITRLKNEIAELEKTLARKKAYLKKLEK